MANIFSGIFSGGQNSGTALAHYNQRLKDYQDRKDAAEQQQAIQSSDVNYKASKEGMTLERQQMMDYARKLMLNPATFDKGAEIMSKMFGQRGGTVADYLKQAEATKQANLRHQYKVDNTIPGSENSKIAVAKQFIEWAKEDIAEKGEKSRFWNLNEAELAEMAWRAEPILETEDSYVGGITGSETMKNLIRGGIKKELVEPYANRLNNFQASVDDSEDLLNFAENRVDDIRQLYATTNNWTTGIGSLLAKINPYSEAADWERLKATIVSNIGLDKIMSLKAGSAQGATGLGALNEKELEMLQNYAGNLLGASDADEIKRILRRLERDLKRSQKRIMRELPKELTFHNQYKQYLPLATDEPYVPSENQAPLFVGGEYKRAPVENLQLEKEEIDVKSLSDEDLLEGL